MIGQPAGVLAKAKKILSLSRQRAREGHLSVLQQVAEMVALRALRGVGPRYYHTGGFWRTGMTWQEKSGQMSAREYRRFVDRWNPDEYRKLSQNKIAEKAILTLFDLPTPRFLGRLAADNGLDRNGRALRSGADLAGLISAEGLERVVFKELEGYGGLGVRIARVKHGADVQLSPANADDFRPAQQYVDSALKLQAGGNWLVEKYFDQHPTIAAVNPTSVNSVRIWIVEVSGAEAVVVTAYLRIGRAHMYVDNATSGGIVAPIDLASGELTAARDAHADRKIYPAHPDHGAAIEGVRIPHWDEVQDVARRALSVFPHLRFAGLDVAIGPAGPVVLELNVSPDREAAAYTGRATRWLLDLPLK